MPVDRIVETFVDCPTERIVEKIVEIPVERVVIKEVLVEVVKEVVVERIVEVTSAHRLSSIASFCCVNFNAFPFYYFFLNFFVSFLLRNFIASL